MENGRLNGIQFVHFPLRIADIGFLGVFLLRQQHDFLPKQEGFQQLHLVAFRPGLTFDTVQGRSRREGQKVLKILAHFVPTGLVSNGLGARRQAQKRAEQKRDNRVTVFHDRQFLWHKYRIKTNSARKIAVLNDFFYHSPTLIFIPSEYALNSGAYWLFELYSLQGQLLQRDAAAFGQGAQQYDLALHDITKGFYLLRIRHSDGFEQTVKVIIQ